jgi:hypothetical protein
MVLAQLNGFCLRTSLPFLSSTSAAEEVSLAFFAAGPGEEVDADFDGAMSATSTLAARFGFAMVEAELDWIKGRFSASLLEEWIDAAARDFVLEALRLRLVGGMARSMLMSVSESIASKHDEGDGEGGGARTLIARVRAQQCKRYQKRDPSGSTSDKSVTTRELTM